MNRPSLHRIALILVFLIACSCVFGQAGSNSAAQYTITKDCYPSKMAWLRTRCFCGLQDKAGFLWFGTRNGLNRYDGKNCLLFTRQRNNLQENKVVQLAKDDANNLFIEYGSNRLSAYHQRQSGT